MKRLHYVAISIAIIILDTITKFFSQRLTES